jgi:ferredoxin
MAKRKIIKIEEEKCTGCGLCIPNCPEGALQIIDGKARLISDLFCDGLGACIGHCPEGAIIIEEREAEKYNEKKVMANIVKQGKNVIIAHLKHLKEHNEMGYLKEAVEFLKEKGIDVPREAVFSAKGPLPCGCPGTMVKDFSAEKKAAKKPKTASSGESQLRQWPVQIMLVPPFAPYLEDSDLLIAADCVPFTYANFHDDLLKGKVLLVGCPKLDDVSVYKEKFKQIFKDNNIKSVTYAHMEVPCCFGLIGVIQSAISDSGKKVSFKEATISIKGERLN